MLLLSPRCTVALRFDGLPGFGAAAAYCTPFLLGRCPMGHARKQMIFLLTIASVTPPVIFSLILWREVRICLSANRIRHQTTSLAMALLARLAACREQLKQTAEQLREARDDKDASRIAQETIDFLTHWLKSFGHCRPSSLTLSRGRGSGSS